MTQKKAIREILDDGRISRASDLPAPPATLKGEIMTDIKEQVKAEELATAPRWTLKQTIEVNQFAADRHTAASEYSSCKKPWPFVVDQVRQVIESSPLSVDYKFAPNPNLKTNPCQALKYYVALSADQAAEGTWRPALEGAGDDWPAPGIWSTDNVLKVKLPAAEYLSGVVTLKPNDKLVGTFKARREGELARQVTRVYRPGNGEAIKDQAESVFAILYHRHKLEENNEATTSADWEIVSLNAYPTKVDDDPITVGTLLANHFELHGGSATDLADSVELVNWLRASVMFWQDKAILTKLDPPAPYFNDGAERRAGQIL